MALSIAAPPKTRRIEDRSSLAGHRVGQGVLEPGDSDGGQPVLLDEPPDLLGVRRRGQHELCARLQVGEGDAEAGDVEEGVHREGPVVGLDAEGVGDVGERGEPSPLREQAALRRSGGARRVELHERPSVVGPRRVPWPRFGPCECGADVVTDGPGPDVGETTGGREVRQRRVDEGVGDAGVVDLEGQIGGHEADVQRHHHGAEQRRGEARLDHVGVIGRQDRQSRSLPDVGVGQHGREPCRAVGQLGVGARPAVPGERDPPAPQVLGPVGEIADDHRCRARGQPTTTSLLSRMRQASRACAAGYCEPTDG